MAFYESTYFSTRHFQERVFLRAFFRDLFAGLTNYLYLCIVEEKR
jgi:hypothetical protein